MLKIIGNKKEKREFFLYMAAICVMEKVNQTISEFNSGILHFPLLNFFGEESGLGRWRIAKKILKHGCATRKWNPKVEYYKCW